MVVVADNIMIKATPLPYADKMLPFVDFRCVEHPGQFYGIGITDIVLQLSAEDSAIRNLQLDRGKFAVGIPVFAGATVYGELEDVWNRYEPNQVIPVSDINLPLVEERLDRIGIEPETVDLLRNTIETCEYSRYAPDAVRESPREISRNAGSIIKSIENAV